MIKKIIFSALCFTCAASPIALEAMTLQRSPTKILTQKNWSAFIKSSAARPWELVKNSRIIDYCKKNPEHVFLAACVGVVSIAAASVVAIAWYNRLTIFHNFAHQLAAQEKTQGLFKKLVRWNIIHPSSAIAGALCIDSDKALTFILKELETNITSLKTWSPEQLYTLFRFAIIRQNLSVIKALIEQKYVDVNSKNKWLNLPLHDALETKNLEIIQYLIKEGRADVNVGCYAGGRYTPLESMVLKNNLDVIKILVEIGHADVNVNQRHPLLLAINGISVENDKGAEKFEIIKYLAEHGARLGSIIWIPKEAPQKVLAYYALIKACDELYLTPNLATKPELFDFFAKKYLEDGTCLVDALRLILSLKDNTLMNHLVRWFKTQTDEKRQQTVVDTVGKTNLILTTIDLSVLWPELFRVN